MSTGAAPLNDPNVKIPPAVKAIAARADEVHRQAYAKDPPVDPPKDPPKDPPADPPKDPVTPLADATPPADGNEPPKGGWEHAYKSMKGRYERATESVRTLSERVSGLENVIASLQAQQPPQPPAPKDPTKDPANSALTPKEIEDYGAEFLGVVGKKAKEIVSPEVAELKREVAGLKNQLQNVGQTVSMDARGKMRATLSQEISNWEQVNLDPEFLNWLSLPDTFSGAIRHNLLKDAWGRNDTARVLAFFKGFLAQEAALAPADTKPAPTQPNSGKVPLETFAAPGRAKPAADNGSPVEKPTFTRAQIADFYRDSAAGRYRGREKEKDTLEQQIFAAERDGRIR